MKPAVENIGDGAGKWFVNVEDGMESLLAVGSEWLDALAFSGEENNDKFYFKTELAAYTAAANYYLFHGEIYPYTDRWQELQALEVGTMPIESTVMDFE